MRAKTPTVYDVAARAGVSIATVSRVFAGPGPVRPATRERVLSAADELGYVPSASARGLAGNRTGVFGVLLPEHDEDLAAAVSSDAEGTIAVVDDRDGSRSTLPVHLYYDELLRGLEAASWRAGRALLVSASRGVSRDMVMNDIAGRVDALAVMSRAIPDELIARAARRLPIVMLAGDAPAGSIDHVSVDNAGGMHALTRHVVDTKPTGPILYLDGPPASPDAAARRAGFLRALPAGLEHHTARTDFTRESGRAATERALRSIRPGAVVAANDESALGAIAALHAARIPIPDDCVVTGFDGIDGGRYATPTLTTVRQPMAALGTVAIDLLLRRLESPDSPPQAVELGVHVLLRDSCPPRR